jgi:hypothetical protein
MLQMIFFVAIVIYCIENIIFLFAEKFEYTKKIPKKKIKMLLWVVSYTCHQKKYSGVSADVFFHYLHNF